MTDGEEPTLLNHDELPPLPPVTPEMRKKRLEITEEDLPPLPAHESDMVEGHEKRPPSEELGEVAVRPTPVTRENINDLYSGDFDEHTAGSIVKHVKWKEEDKDRASVRLDEAHGEYDQKGKIAQKLPEGGRLKKRRIPYLEAQEAAAQENIQAVVEHAKQYIDKMHEEAEGFVAAWQEYVKVQDRLANITGVKPEMVIGIEEYIRITNINYGVMSEVGKYRGIMDYFMPPVVEDEDAPDYLPRGRRAPREELGLDGEKALEQAESKGYPKLLRIGKSYRGWIIPTMMESLDTTGIPLKPAEKNLYVPLDEVNAKDFLDSNLDGITFETDVDESGKAHTDRKSSLVILETTFQLMTPEQVKHQVEWEKLPESAVVKIGDEAIMLKGSDAEELKEQITNLVVEKSKAHITSGDNSVHVKDYLDSLDSSTNSTA